MGRYLSPGNSGFERIAKSGYVDKTGIVAEINRRIGTTENLVCVSRPRRFGKSYAAQLLCAYYDCSCDSHGLFRNYKISESADYEVHINQYHVICIDIAGAISELKQQRRSVSELSSVIAAGVRADLVASDASLMSMENVSDCLKAYAGKSGRKFVFVIDEWDAVFREAKNDTAAQADYLNLLKTWFKNINFTPYAVAAAYMTGILPIKKDGSQSAISDFVEYPILYPDSFAVYTGFTEKEVQSLCEEQKLNFDDFKAWYDGYDFPECGAVYNPYSVMRAVSSRKCRSYWKKTSAAESLMTYVNMDFDGLQETVARLIAGEEIDVNVDTFENDFETFKSRDDVLTLLIHLGYLTYSEDEKTVRIPNEEVRIEFRQILEGTDVSADWVKLIRKSQQLLEDTLAGNEEAVARAITEIRDTEYAPTFYNDEQALRYVLKFAYIAAVNQYMKVEELPSGRGIADVVYIPKRRSLLPALLIELKWNKPVAGAVAQIRERNYPAVLKSYGGDVVLAGLAYDEKTKKHSCSIEKLSVKYDR